jgi:diguanylate cyclase
VRPHRSDALIVRAVVELGHDLGLTRIAEGVEDEATWPRLRPVGCDLAQGHHLSRPVSVQQLEAWHDDARGAFRG